MNNQPTILAIGNDAITLSSEAEAYEQLAEIAAGGCESLHLAYTMMFRSPGLRNRGMESVRKILGRVAIFPVMNEDDYLELVGRH